MAEMTLNEFRATKVWCEDMAQFDWWQFPRDENDPARGYVYLDQLYIDKLADGRFDLVIGNSEYTADDQQGLWMLERELYVFAGAEQYFEIPISELEALAKEAYPTSDEDWGSARQIHAQNRFCYAADTRLSDEQTRYWRDWSLKATSEEIISEGLALLKGESRFFKPEVK